MKQRILLPLLLALTFFVVGLVTLPGYGINWDTVNHLPRGQAYLHYFLTGKKDYSDLQDWKLYWQKPESLFIDTDLQDGGARRSFYQSNATTFDWFMLHDGNGHPPLSDILSSVFNHILFISLGLINDIDAYRVYGIFLAASLVALVFYWNSSNYGKLAGFVASLSLASYPLFWSEAHFNTEKDIPETVYISFLLFFYWLAFRNKQFKWYVLAGLAFGLALGTKFNVIFASLVIVPWILGSLILKYSKAVKTNLLIKDLRMLFLGSFLILGIGFGIFFLSWPYLWADPISRILGVANFYKVIGFTESVDPRFTGPLGINLYPIQWILYTTPPVVLALFVLGLIAVSKNVIKSKDNFSLLLLIWLIVPILRVTWPGTTIYGGVRQIMEYIPATALIAGVGSVSLFNFLISQKLLRNYKKIIFILIPLLFIPHFVRLYSIHPNENVYFNFLINGLSGAKEANIPSWGNSFGAAYRQGVIWINQNAKQGSNVVFAYELLPNVPRIFFRQDLNVYNSNRSGFLRKGEYAITLVYQGTEDRSYYDSYLEKFLEPAYTVSVDKTSILKVWINDETYLKKPWKESLIEKVEYYPAEGDIKIDLGGVKELSRLEIDYSESNCSPMKSGTVSISEDGIKWTMLPGVLPRSWRISALGEQPREGRFLEPFVGQRASYILLSLSPQDTCLTKIKDIRAYEFLD